MLEREALEAVRQILGRIRTSTVRPKVFVLPWSLLGQWGFEAGIRAQLPPTQASFPEVLISQVCTISSGGTPPRYRKDYFGGPIPWVKTTEVRDAVIEGTEETLTEAGLQSSSARVYPQGSLIVAMYGQGATRGRTAKLGIEAATNQACAVLTNFDSRIEPDYLWVYLMSEYEHLRALASGNNQPNLNAGMIATYPLPLPPLDVQRELVARVAEARAEAGRLRKEARRLREETRAEVEAMILGTGLAATADS
ncbi:restriction endonuclease subunit S [Deinococcus aestuarii]|uniref:restriction endonuclease subunit S n=1 Tax=Deinococcus aestuarii TaxID=2774531 RepID=UPI001C0DACBB|nr:restriction endonuclease subunit S [Deinococcus aestuarii]